MSACWDASSARRSTAVAYRGDRPALNDVRDNKIPAAVASLPSTLEYHRGGKVRIVVTSADARLTLAPTLPSAFEHGRTNLISTEWYGFFASPGTPGPIVDLWNMHLRAVLEEKEAKAELTNVGVNVRDLDARRTRATRRGIAEAVA